VRGGRRAVAAILLIKGFAAPCEKRLGQEAADLGGDEFAGGVGWDQTFEHAQVGVDGDVGVGDFDRAFDGRAEQTHLRGESES